MRRAVRAITCLYLLAAAVLHAQPTSDDLDARVRAFAQEVRCVVCQNEALADSRAEIAVDLRRLIREQMAAGRSDEEIRTFLTDRYGDFVLYRPRLRPVTYVLWFGPFVLLVTALIVLRRTLSGAAATDGPHLSHGDRIRVRRLLDSPVRSRSDSRSVVDANVAAYRRHVAELTADWRLGRLTDDELAREREAAEIRLIGDVRAAATARRAFDRTRPAGALRCALALAAVSAVLLLYLMLGSPELLRP